MPAASCTTVRTSIYWPGSQKSSQMSPQGTGLCQAGLKAITTNHADTSEPTSAAALDPIFLSKHFSCKSPQPYSRAESCSSHSSNTHAQSAHLLRMQWVRWSRGFSSENLGLKSCGRQTEQSFSLDYRILNTSSAACAHSVLPVTFSAFLVAVAANCFTNSIVSSSVVCIQEQ